MPASENQPDDLMELFTLFMRRSMHSAIIHSREYGLSMPQFSTLMVLRQRGIQTISEIAEGLGVSTAAASQMVDRMVQDGLILRTEAPNDRRVKQVNLTEKASRLIRDNLCARKNWMTEIIENLSEDETAQLHQTFDILLRHIKLQEQHPNAETGDNP